MVVLNRIYTRTGDDGETGLGDGTRTDKFSPRVEAYGTVDELNAAVGVARLHASTASAGKLAAIQNDLFDLGADLCLPQRDDEAESEHPPLRVTEAQVGRLEKEIDRFNAELDPLRSFVLPGGSTASSYLHLCRTVARRAERRVVELSRSEAVNSSVIHYLNRLSDWFFVAARSENAKGRNDVLWVPGASRNEQ